MEAGRASLVNAQAAASTTAPIAPGMYEVTRTMGALLRIRSVETGRAKTAHDENCKLRAHTIAVSGEGEKAEQGAAAARQLHATAEEANVAVLQGDHHGPPTTERARSKKKRRRRLSGRRPQQAV